MTKISKIILSFIIVLSGLNTSFVFGMRKRGEAQPAIKAVWHRHVRPGVARDDRTRAFVGLGAFALSACCLTCLACQAAQLGDTNDAVDWAVWGTEALSGVGCCTLGTWACCGWPSCGGCCADDEETQRKGAHKDAHRKRKTE